MKVLLIDDDQSFVRSFLEALHEIEPAILCSTAASKSGAAKMLDRAEFDLILCDLSLPSIDGALDEDVLHGVAVYQYIRQLYRGTPVFILTGHGEENIHFITDAVGDSPREDVFGTGVVIPQTQFVSKARVGDGILKMVDFCHMIRRLEEIEIGGQDDNLLPAERRLLRIFARRHNGAIVEVKPLGGGLSSSKTLHVTVKNAALVKTASAVGKLGSFETTDDEVNRYRKHIAPLLGPGSFTAYSGEVRAGSGCVAGLFYTLAEEYGRSLFDILYQSDKDAVMVLDRLAEMQRPWTNSTTSHRVAVEELRKNLISQASFLNIEDRLRAAMPVDKIERTLVTAKYCPRHGDLHGLNILVSNDYRPVMIDYGDVGIWSSCYDFIVLELSVLFHPAGCDVRGSWPSIEAAKTWCDLEAYCALCPFPEFIRRCRHYAVKLAAGKREVLANAYAFAVRQFKYPNTDKDLALAVAEAAARNLLDS
jgi:CheY-like chemotaxis protein